MHQNQSEEKKNKTRILVAVTGASGSLYAEALIKELITRVDRVYLVASETAKKIAHYELEESKENEFSLKRALKGKLTPEEKKVLRVFDANDYFAPSASGTSTPDAMVVLPCSMGALARIATGVSSSLIERSADVILKQKKQLILCPRETPLNRIHLKNMLELSELGAHLIPAMPGFYQKPKTISDLVDFMTGRVLEALSLEHELYEPWALHRF